MAIAFATSEADSQAFQFNLLSFKLVAAFENDSPLSERLLILNCVQDDIIYPIETEESLQFPRFVFDHA
jgi:hypothetical protein